jgi:recombination protein RecA
MSAELAFADGVLRGRDFIARSSCATDDWGMEAMAGRLIELSGASSSATFSVCACLIHQAQKRQRLVAWIEGAAASFYPPDFAACGIDVTALPVIRSGDTMEACSDADIAIRSGAFALVVLNLGSKARLSFKTQSRLASLSKHHNAAVVLLTRRNTRDYANGSLVSLRAITAKRRAGHNSFVCEVQIAKDKRRAPGWNHMELRCGPAGLC